MIDEIDFNALIELFTDILMSDMPLHITEMSADELRSLKALRDALRDGRVQIVAKVP